MRLFNENLSNYTTLKIGGPAEVLTVPSSEDELLNEIRDCISNGYKYRILGNGSNLLISDKGIKGVVICNTNACLSLEMVDNNKVYAGSSVLLQKFVRFCVDNNLEGMEYLYSIPGTLGGAIYMNAGRGRKSGLSISDKIESVRIFDGNEIKMLAKEDCNFQYRSSIFLEKHNWMVLGATFKLGDQPKDIGQKKIKERMEFVKKTQLRNYPNAGSIFKKRSKYVNRLIKRITRGNAQLNNNWISNLGNAKYRDVIWLIRIVSFLSYITFTKPELEIEIWEK